MVNLEITNKQGKYTFEEFVEIIRLLRAPGGCPWDREQTHKSIRNDFLEEAYEAADAIDTSDDAALCEELGDVLLHVAFYAKIASEKQQFDMKDVCDRLCDKLIYRHPHVFGTTKAETAGEVCKNWEQLKMSEKGGNKSILSGVPASMPSLIKAYRMQEKAANVGFDWDRREQVWEKVHEEIDELKAELDKGDKVNMEKEFGDFIFSLVNIARFYDINPDNALEQTNKKFRNRFNYVEEHSIKQGRNLKDMTLEQMDELWNEAKRLEKDADAKVLK